MSPFSKTPFLFILIPLIVGILVQYYFQITILSIIFSLLGGLMMLLSFKWEKEHLFNYRWLFGLSTLLLFIGIGGGRTYLKQQSLSYILQDTATLYVGYITETPQNKPRSIVHKLYLPAEDIDIVCYMAKDSARLPLEVGDEIVFLSQLHKFKNRGNPDDFDYERYMYNQGFVASTYLSSASWMKTGNTHSSLKIIALKIRQKIIEAYSTLGFSKDEQAILSALTLGYQDTLSDDLKQGFRTTGTVHILSVSGLHVGIFYAMITFMLSFIARSSRFYKIRPILIITILWIYAFITGLPPSVVRASTILSIFCLSEIVSRKNNPLNTLYIAAFVMLLYNPFWFFDIGFQLSYLSVLSILILYKPMCDLYKFKNKIGIRIWQMFSISVIAQLATFPLCLYYFGTFPTYFFLSNLIIVPLATLTIYGEGGILLAWILSLFSPSYANYIYYVPVKLEQLFVNCMTTAVSMLESLPFALIDDVKISFGTLFLLIIIIIALLRAVMKTSAKSLLVALATTVILLSCNLNELLRPSENKFIIYNDSSTNISLLIHDKENSLKNLIKQKENPVICLDDKNILLLNSIFKDFHLPKERFILDYLVIMNDQYLDLDFLEQYFTISSIVLDSSLEPYTRRYLTKECEKKGLPFHDVKKDGAFTIFFANFAD